MSNLSLPPRLALAHTPTPVWRERQLDELVGCELWVKRDDMTGGAEAGNKIRKLEFLLAAARAAGATTLITCGAAQSNHARATALLGRRLGLASHLLLRSSHPDTEPETGNLRLMQLSGAAIDFISVEQYAERSTLIAELAERLRRRGEVPYVIPEGGSNGLGSLGYVRMAEELAQQQRIGLCPERFDTLVAACGSGGTVAGLALGIASTGSAERVDAICVCDDTAYFESVTRSIIDEARALVPALGTPATLVIHDAFKGPAYAVPSDEQRTFFSEVTQRSGLVLDPTYSGKALFGLAQLEPRPSRALFVHTGGLPGLLA